jgi:hypothetical protein
MPEELHQRGEYAAAAALVAAVVLGPRKGITCDAPGIRARAAFVVRNGKIVQWAQLPVNG